MVLLYCDNYAYFVPEIGIFMLEHVILIFFCRISCYNPKSGDALLKLMCLFLGLLKRQLMLDEAKLSPISELSSPVPT